MASSPLARRQFLCNYDEIVGNGEVKLHLRNLVLADGTGPNTFILGPPRTGKTAAVHWFLRSILCLRRHPNTLDACRRCDSCRDDDTRYSRTLLWSALRDSKFSVAPVDCTTATENSLLTTIVEVQQQTADDDVAIIYLDEVNRLVRRGLDHVLLKPLEETNALWIGTAATIEGIDDMFFKRFPARLETRRPSHADLVNLLANRCREFELDVDDGTTLDLLAEHSHRVVGDAVAVLEVACLGGALTRELVESYCFEPYRAD